MEHDKARELLAGEYERRGLHGAAKDLRAPQPVTDDYLLAQLAAVQNAYLTGEADQAARVKATLV
jgi:hypothetical protein